MHMVIDTLYYANYKFFVEFDSGSETGSNQLTVWVAEKADIETVELKQFSSTQLLNALLEPERSRQYAKLEDQRRLCQQSFELQIANLQQPFSAGSEKPGKKLPARVKQGTRKLRKQLKSSLQHLDAEFARRELWSLDRQSFDRDLLQAQSQVLDAERSLRSFYFAEANDSHIRNFCRKFALDPAYRQQVLTGETRWARRNALFVRNLCSVVDEDALLWNGNEYDRQSRKFFYWLDVHSEEILALPTYQRLLEQDFAFEPCASEFDPAIRLAVETLNRIPGVTSRFSCQGVSGMVQFQGRELLAVSPHEQYAYVSFSALEQPIRDVIATLLPSFPNVTCARIPCRLGLDLVLRSTGDNLRFREELLELATCLLSSVSPWSVALNESTLPSRSTAEARKPKVNQALDGLSLARLAWLCLPEQIERTLHLLFYLNHWAKPREQLLYADRQGLYRVKAAIAQQAYMDGLINPASYLDGSSGFARDYSLDFAANMAAETLLERLTLLFEDSALRPADNANASAALTLFAHFVGHAATSRADIEALDVARLNAFLLERLEELIAQARSTRQPIPTNKLAALYIEPLDLLNIYWTQNRPSPRWDELDEAETLQLDPEGLSLIAFEYASPTAHYIFHLPFRIAERFLPQQCVHDLRSLPGSSRECGEFFGRTITEEESQEHPIREILRELEVDVTAICPYGLIDKSEYIAQRASRYAS